jgi:phospholipid/cholesterol/gamma-HCH transport system ATP-binding protein
MGDMAVRFEDVSKSFDARPVLQGLDLDVPRGATLTVMGGSGSGKTVTLRLTAGLIKPDRGRITVLGTDATPLREEALLPLRKRMGFVFQGAALFDSLTVYENVAYPLRALHSLAETDIRGWVHGRLAEVGLPENAAAKTPAELSGGMRKRVGLARALALDPEVMLYDEPTTGLDPMTALTIDAEIIKLRDIENVTSVLVTHQLRDAFYVATHAASREADGRIDISPADQSKQEQADFVMLRDAQIAFEGSAEQLRQSSDPYLKAFLS